MRNRTGCTEPSDVSYQCLRGCNRGSACLSSIPLETAVQCEAKLYGALNTYSLGPRRSPFCPQDWGLGWFALTDRVQWLQHVRGGSGRQREVRSVGIPSLISHQHRGSAAALTFNRLTRRGRVRAAASPTRSYREGASEQTDIYGRWQFANISICAKALGVTMSIAMKLEESAASIYSIRSFFPATRLNCLTAWCYRMCQNTHQNPFCPNTWL